MIITMGFDSKPNQMLSTQVISNLQAVAVIAPVFSLICFCLSWWELHHLRDLAWMKRIEPLPERRKSPKITRPEHAHAIPDNALYWKEIYWNPSALKVPVKLMI